MVNFFASSESGDSDSSSEDEQIQHSQVTIYTFSDDDDEEFERVKEKCYEELTNIIKQISNFKNIKDISSMLKSFQELQKAHVKALPVIAKAENRQTPKFFVRCLAEMKDFIYELWEDRDSRKNMSKNNRKSLAIMRKKLKKYLKDFKADIIKFKKNPDQSDDEEEEEKNEPEADNDNDVPVESQLNISPPKPTGEDGGFQS